MPQTRFVTRKALAPGPQADRGREQGRPRRRAPGLGREPDLRAVRQAGRQRGPARLPGGLRLGAARAGRSTEGRRDAARTCGRCSTRSSRTSRRRRAIPTRRCSCRSRPLDYSSYVGRIGIGRIRRGTIRKAQQVVMRGRRAPGAHAKVGVIHTFQGWSACATEVAAAGDIVSSPASRTSRSARTLADPENPEALPMTGVDEPTLTMNFQVNTSPARGPAKASTSRAGRSATACCASCSPTWRCASRTRATRTCSWSRGAASCTSRSCSRTCAARATRSRWRKPRVVVKRGRRCPQEPYELLTVDVEDDAPGRA